VKTSKQFQKKKDPSVPLKLRIHRDNERRYAEPVYSGNGKLKALCCRVNGKEERHPEGVYYLRVKGKKWVRVGQDAEFARTKQQQLTAAVRANDVGVEVEQPRLASEAVVGFCCVCSNELCSASLLCAKLFSHVAPSKRLAA
jgi:hypothetical protein